MKLLRKIRAFINRTFVTDCPHCHKHFYGFHNYKENIMVDKIHYRIVCHKCSDTRSGTKGTSSSSIVPDKGLR